MSAVLCSAALSTVLVPPVAVAAPGVDPRPRSLVALGDSFASGPLIPLQYEAPLGCLRSSSNYAHQLARRLRLDLVDVTCSGASTKHMWETHGVTPEAQLSDHTGSLGYPAHPGNPPQLGALRRTTDLVTLQIGGNDIGFAGLATTCAEGSLSGVGCREAVAAERPFDRIAATAPKIRAVLGEIRRRAPKASIYVLGYPGIFKIGPTASCPAMGAGEPDAQYLRSIQEALNDMIRSVAEETSPARRPATTYVDVYGPSAGRTACDLPLLRWVEPIVPVNAALPVHPNLGGMTAITGILVEAVRPTRIPPRHAQPGGVVPPASPVRFPG